ncbi:MAG: TIGR02206 family membrane protein [Verrucomicrobiota bacterium]
MNFLATAERFQFFSFSHWVVLVLVAGVFLWLHAAGKEDPDCDRACRQRKGLGLVLLVCYPLALAVRWSLNGASPYLTWANALPMHLCDWAAIAGGIALLTGKPLFAELTYFWALAGTLQGLLTPSLYHDFPHPIYFTFFLLHGSVVLAGLYLPLTLKWRPRPGARRRVILWTHVYGAMAVFVNQVGGRQVNYGFLREKPAGSLLEWMGDWPWYILWMMALVVFLAWLLFLPFDRQAKRREDLDGSETAIS